MLKRIKNLLESGQSFAFETTLSTRSYVKLVEKAKQLGYKTSCFFWLDSEELAISRVETRVKEGGHHIEEEVIRRRYKRGLSNLFDLYVSRMDNWVFVDNSGNELEILAEGDFDEEKINNEEKWNGIKGKYHAN
jgi:predicted ABC-type ATPase